MLVPRRVQEVQDEQDSCPAVSKDVKPYIFLVDLLGLNHDAKYKKQNRLRDDYDTMHVIDVDRALRRPAAAQYV